MANLFAVHSISNSLISYLRNTYPETLQQQHPCEFTLFSSGQLAELGELTTTVSLFLYRVTLDEHLRNQERLQPDRRRNVPLPLNLHYLLTVWSNSAEAEHNVFTWAMRQLYQQPIFNRSLLANDADWGSDEFLQVIPAEISNEDIMRIWDAIEPSYRLSFPYVVRTIQVNKLEDLTEYQPVVATRFSWSAVEDGP